LTTQSILVRHIVSPARSRPSLTNTHTTGAMASAQDLISTVYPDTIAEVARLSAIDDPDAEPFKSKYAAAALLEALDGQLLPLLVRPGRYSYCLAC